MQYYIQYSFYTSLTLSLTLTLLKIYYHISMEFKYVVLALLALTVCANLDNVIYLI
jgi:hypothetical protein